ncbi:Dor1-domain-containing protein [Stereum hirsutum FP-91666 SS1]|uniref:Dor1-domain-containing protein n=1 Tax=Stereum hirsutum (strain FP-91666) TaxID=721885 RepID=UPI0004449587|nr:Dor1-domain-containing protein [Stereum hirsutum FP-91666 SS1]EIM83195.1 Dor1-domain-containing protein [Stereum hirsutum FP-91666 SS1]
MTTAALLHPSDLSPLLELLDSPSTPPIDVEAARYLSHLTTLPLSTLLSEPPSLSSTSSQLTNALTTLCTSSYPTFLALHSSTTSLSTSLSAFSNSLSSLLSTLPLLESSSTSFSAESKTVQAERKAFTLVLSQSPTLHSILDIPLLTDLCIHNNLYNEALDLHAHASALALKYPEVEVVRDVKAEVDGAIRGLVCNLLGMLSEPGVKLPALWKAVGILKRMDVLGEEELAVAFLSGRGACVEGALNGVRSGLEGEEGKEKWVRYMKKYVDVWREGLHDLITQFSTIFLSSPSTSPSTPSQFIQSLLPTFTSHTLKTHLLPTLHLSLPHIAHDPSSLTALLSQLNYCAASFARVGLDFRNLLGPIFEDAVRGNVEAALRSATENFVGVVESHSHKWTQGRKPKPSDWLLALSPLGVPVLPPSPSPPPNHAQPNAAPHIPPQILASFPPLAVFVNSILTTFNALRLLAPIGLGPELIEELDRRLARGGRALLRYVQIVQEELLFRRSSVENDGDGAPQTHEEMEPGNDRDRERSVLRRVGEVWPGVVVPFLRWGLSEGVFGAPTMIVAGLGHQSGESAERGMREGWARMGEGLEGVMQEWRDWLASQGGEAGNAEEGSVDEG